MPELPEVETIARRLQEPLLGRRVAGIQLLWERTLAEPTPEVFGQRIVGPRICSLRRRGKFLVFGLSGRLFLLVHLRMTGRLEVLPPEAPRSPHTRVIFDLDDGRELRFADARKFGRIWLVDDPEVVLGDLGPEPLAEAFTAEVFRELLAGRQGRIKPLLLDQRFLAGLGNIYADEALHLAGVHPCRPACSLTEEEAGRLHQAIRQVLQEAIGDGGGGVKCTPETGQFSGCF